MFPDFKVLVAEQEDRTREAFVQLIEAAGCGVSSVKSGGELKDSILQQKADIYISATQFKDITIYDILPVLDKMPLIFVTAASFDLAPAIEAIEQGAYDYLMLPPNEIDVRHALNRARTYLQLLQQNNDFHRIGAMKAEVHALKKALSHMQESYYTTLEALVAALDAREHETANHSKRVSAYALLLAQCMKLPQDQLEDISLGSLLHDIGKIGVPDAVLLKPAALDQAEWVEMKRHPGVGFRILKDIKKLTDASQIVLSHQEKYDGSGYPRRLTKDKITIGARIFSVVDAFDAITSDRPYRKATSIESAKYEIAKYAGTQFDPDIVGVFLDVDEENWLVIKQTFS